MVPPVFTMTTTIQITDGEYIEDVECTIFSNKLDEISIVSITRPSKIVGLDLSHFIRMPQKNGDSEYIYPELKLYLDYIKSKQSVKY